MKHTNHNTFSRPTLKLKPVCLGISLVLGLASVSQAAIVSTNGAGVMNQSNGPTIVHIKGASNNGVSHNIYNQFDVDQKGVILNNSQANTNTQLGGTINGNLNLANGNGPAKVILNEVNSNKASTLNGMVEVAGDKAQVIVANASGITCNNCGFINTDRVTLTTGKTLVAGGDVIGYNIEKGQIIINNRLQSDSPTDVLARAVAIKGDIHAKELNIVAGSNFVDATGQYATEITGVNPAYRVGIDVSNLGGMYANKITLVSTDNNTSINNVGTVAAGSGGLSINSKGLIYNGKTLQSNGAIDVNSQGLSNRGSISSHANINIKAGTGTIDNNSATIKSLGGDVNLSTINSLNNQNGTISADQNIVSNSGYVYNSNGLINTTRGDINIRSTGNIDNSNNLRNNYNNPVKPGIVSGGDVTIDTVNLTNTNSNIIGRDITINARSLVNNNSNATIDAKRRVAIDAVEVRNSNSLIKSTNGKMDIVADKSISNDKYATISSGKALNVTSAYLGNSGAITSSAGKSTFNVTQLTNNAGYIKGNNLVINSNSISNQYGLIKSDTNININTSSLNNTYSSSFKNYSSIFGLAGSEGGLQVDNGSIIVKANSLNNYSGNINANLTERTGTKGDVDITLRNDLDNRYGKINGMNDVKLDINYLNNLCNGLITAGRDLTIKAFSRVDNYGGKLASLRNTTISSPIIYNGTAGIILGSMVILDTSKYY